MTTSTSPPRDMSEGHTGVTQRGNDDLPRAGTTRSFVAWLADSMPTAAVLATLAGIAYFGHTHDWKLPKFSEVVRGREPGEASKWCGEHGVPERDCVECKAELMPRPKDYGWCKAHGISSCPLCHPDVAQVRQTPAPLPSDLERAKRALAIRPRPENNSKCTLYRRRIQFASLDAVKKIGLDVELVERAPFEECVIANGELVYDQTRVARLCSKAEGTVWRVFKQVGDRVAANDVLALVDAAEVGRAKADLMGALAQWELAAGTKDRLAPLTKDGAVAGSRLLETQAAVREARLRVVRAQQMLVNLGLPVVSDELLGLDADEIASRLKFLALPDELTKTFDPRSTTSNLLPLCAPFEGLVVDGAVVPGDVVDSRRVLLTLADTQRMWLTLDVPCEEADYVKVGQTVHFQSSGSRDAVTGRIFWISSQADGQTRAVKVRAIVDNSSGRLRSETFGLGRIVLRSEPEAIVVPSESVQWDGSCHVVFVRDKNFFAVPESPKVFYPRPVRIGAREERRVEILAGVLPGEVVATRGSGVLRGELLKNNLGAG